ncbi:UNKNOWN [Stylonychia lemnae]|uniref:B box-type domain-containing protein n=1 Tax=Stylonychia lemnae TaxID=5949 RepID=A0A078A4J7_STYLE|nr:UNKNOWN [Stylonychia lemnae]|eukprot:CDW77178.1 UNKNOWN [Stylonychia lemnae]
MLPSLRSYGQMQMMPLNMPFAICAVHNQDIGQYCRTHQLPLCDYCLQEHTYVDPQLGGFSGNHEFVKIEKIINDAIDHMTKQLQTFDQFIQSKKEIPLYIKPDQVLQYINDDRIFEEAHNHMINRLMKYKNLPNNEKIYYLQQSLQDFDQYYQQANLARQKIADFVGKNQPNQKEQINGDGNHQQKEQELYQAQNQILEDNKINDLIQISNGGSGHPQMSQLLSQQVIGLPLDDDKNDNGKKKQLKKKHYPLTFLVQYPGIDEPLSIQVQNSIRIKQLKQLIKEKAGSDVNVDQMQLQEEGGDIVRKSQISIEDLAIKDGATILVEILDKIQTSSAPRNKKPAKEEPKEDLYYLIRSGNADEGQLQEAKTRVSRSLRLRQLKKNIQDELQIQDKVSLKLYLNGEEITDDKLSVEDANILVHGAQLEVEITQKISIEVQGKGKGYQQDVYVQPTDQIDVLRSKVHFFKLFLQRKHIVVEKKSERLIEDFNKTFFDYNLKDGAQLVMKEPGKQAYKTQKQKQEEEEKKQSEDGQDN